MYGALPVNIRRKIAPNNNRIQRARKRHGVRFATAVPSGERLVYRQIEFHFEWVLLQRKDR